jgi:hypothetical protein
MSLEEYSNSEQTLGRLFKVSPDLLLLLLLQLVSNAIFDKL